VFREELLKNGLRSVFFFRKDDMNEKGMDRGVGVGGGVGSTCGVTAKDIGHGTPNFFNRGEWEGGCRLCGLEVREGFKSRCPCSVFCAHVCAPPPPLVTLPTSYQRNVACASCACGQVPSKALLLSISLARHGRWHFKRDSAELVQQEGGVCGG
jgi:hypothetical protein